MLLFELDSVPDVFNPLSDIDSDSSFGLKETDKLTDTYYIKINGIIINITEYTIEETGKKRYIAEFKNRDINYQLKGIMEKEEFNQILKNLDFS